MKKIINGKYIEVTPEELAGMKSQSAIRNASEKYNPMSADEVARLLIAQQINALQVNKETALRMKSFYPSFHDIVGMKVGKGFKFTFNDKLWSVVQPELTIQAHYPPGTGMESLYEEICEEYAGTADEPIPYNGNMVLKNGKYYVQGDKIYLCNRDTVNPVYHALAELIGLYVKEVK